MKKGYHTLDVTTPKDGLVVMREKHWLCVDGDPKMAIFFNGTAQCNGHIEIPERMLEYTIKKTGRNVSIVFLDVAYRPNPESV